MHFKVKFLYNSVISTFILFYFIVRTYGISGYIPSVWVIFLIFIILYSILIVLKLPRLVLIKFIIESKWIILSFFILIVYILFQYGNFKLYSTFSYLVVSIPFYIIGFYWGIYNSIKYFKTIALGYFIFISLFLFFKLLQIKNFHEINLETIGSIIYPPGQKSNHNELVFFWPFVAFTCVIAISLIKNIAIKKIKFFLCFLVLICFISVFLSGLAAPIVMLFLSFLIYLFQKAKSKSKMRTLLIIPLILFVSYLFIYILGSGIAGNFGTATSKSEGLLEIIKLKDLFDDRILNIITSGRWTAGKYSINQFISAPFIGHGVYLEEIQGTLLDLDHFNTLSAAGGHSFVLDSLAFFGIFGFGFILILSKFSTDALKFYKIAENNEKKRALIFASAIVSVFITNFLNSTFLFSSFDQFLFLCSGFCLGNCNRIKRIR